MTKFENHLHRAATELVASVSKELPRDDDKSVVSWMHTRQGGGICIMIGSGDAAAEMLELGLKLKTRRSIVSCEEGVSITSVKEPN